MIESLPKDVQALIFLRLPVKALLRCLAVCRSWHQFIQHPSFINAHLQHQRRDVMFIRHIPEDSLGFESSSSYDDEISTAGKDIFECYSLYGDDEFFTAYAKHEFPIRNQMSVNYRVVGSCNGIICITNDMASCCHETYLWNPTIRKCIELPYPMFIFGGFNQELGFGFDEKTNDYKVVRIVDNTSWYGPLEVEIYSLSSGSWRKASHLASDLLGVRLFDRIGNVRDNQVYLNGALHWVGGKVDWEKSGLLVIVFHLSDEVFCCFEIPKIISHNSSYDSKPKPVVFQGFLSLIHFRDHKCRIWMMKDYGDSTSWAKHMDVNLSGKVNRVIGLRRNGELLIEIRGGLYSYDSEATKGKDLVILDGMDLQVWKLLQEGSQVINLDWIDGDWILVPNERLVFVRQCVYDYDPESAPKELGIRTRNFSYKFSFHCETYVESLVLLGRVNCNQVESEAEESERRIHQEDDNHVAGLNAEVDNLNVEGWQIGGNSVPW